MSRLEKPDLDIDGHDFYKLTSNSVQDFVEFKRFLYKLFYKSILSKNVNNNIALD